MITSQHYYDRYLKLIERAKTLHISHGEYSEVHHIIPVSLGGTDEKSNLIRLTGRLHFIAHWLLWKSYRNREMAFAFHSMVSAGKTKRYHKINSRVYETLKQEAAVHRSLIMKNKVVVYDPMLRKNRKVSNTDLRYITGELVSVCKDKVTGAIDNNGNRCFVTTTEYKKGNYTRYNSNRVPVFDEFGNGMVIDKNSTEYRSGKFTHVSKNLVTVIDTRTNTTLKVPTDVFNACDCYVGVNFEKNGPNNYNAKIIDIFDNTGKLFITSVGEFKLICETYQLPFIPLKNSYLAGGTPIFTSTRQLSYAEKNNLTKFKGWYAKINIHD